MDPKYLRIASDLHLEALYGRDYASLAVDFLPHDDRDKESFLVLAGDISSRFDQLVGFLKVVAPRFLKVIYVSGNHEYYRSEFKTWNETVKALMVEIPEITAALDTIEQLIIPDYRFIYGTLWADGGSTPYDNMMVDRGLNDFRLIRNGQERFTVHDMIKLHREQKAKIDTLLKEPFDGKSIVITHHMPSYRLCHPRFGAEINGGFAANCDDILAYDHAPALWIHGHTHDSGDGVLWKTRIVCNPAGYRGEYRTSFNWYFDAPKFIELGAL